MSMSENVVQETMRVLRKAADLTVAAEALEITEAGLMYRIYNNSTIMALAIERGLYRPRKKVKQVVEQKAEAVASAGPSSAMGQFDKNADLSKPPRECKLDSVADVNQNAQTPPACQPKAAKPRKRHADGFKRFEVCIPDELFPIISELAKREMRPVNVQAGYMLRQVLEQLP